MIDMHPKSYQIIPNHKNVSKAMPLTSAEVNIKIGNTKVGTINITAQPVVTNIQTTIKKS